MLLSVIYSFALTSLQLLLFVIPGYHSRLVLGNRSNVMFSSFMLCDGLV